MVFKHVGTIILKNGEPRWHIIGARIVIFIILGKLVAFEGEYIWHLNR